MKRYYIDMDGVLAEYKDSAFEELLEQGYFAELKPNENMICLVKSLVKSNPNNVYILSSVLKENPYAESEKNAWLDRYIPEIDIAHRIFPKCGEKKCDYVKDIDDETILFDDYSANLVAWEAAGGRGIKVLNGLNGSGHVWTGEKISIAI